MNVLCFQLDIDKRPRRPQYSLASEIPLNLFDCQFDDVDGFGNVRKGDWVYDLTALDQVKFN